MTERVSEATWEQFLRTQPETPNPLVAAVLDEYQVRRSIALDLGAGNLRDSKFLLRRGFARVVAVDGSASVQHYATRGVEIHNQPVHAFRPEDSTIDFAVCMNTFYYCSPAEVLRTMRNVFLGLRSGGMFVVNVLGNEQKTFPTVPTAQFTKPELLSLCDRFTVIRLIEDREALEWQVVDGVWRMTHSHKLKIVLRKP